ncbi:V-type ATP synthase subunit I [Miniphocaeibacter halophilus]|uniref:V-type ATP synthase subunit I n=1 Tax=Miniphocaeibacter halophilus TaxID=2931922 RepID=A0AC61MXK2_9FIRM|nr:V-type ATPase 116kDa subunit family protein [Miniphocaeibacter halophilus]QQK07358.1 V-type ATP synthase subunit I [Miniphocaeibacter halophilus]
MKSEKMLMMNIIGNISDMDNVISDIVEKNYVQIVDSNDLISHSEFLFPINDENVNMAVDFNYIRKYKSDINTREEENKLNKINDYLEFDLAKSKGKSLKSYNKNEIQGFYEIILENTDKLQEIDNKISEKNELVNLYSKFKNLNIKIEDLYNMNNFKYRFGIFGKDDRIKLKKNYENIFAAIFHLSSMEEGEVYLILYPTDMEVDINRTLRSLNFQEIFLPKEYLGTPVEIIEKLKNEKSDLISKKKNILKEIEKIKEKYSNELKSFLIEKYNKLNIENIKNNIAISDHYFYLAGWVGKTDSEELEKELKKKYKILIQFNDMDDHEGITPPTKLKNNVFFKPFELLVKMYGTPNYEELDPTPFFAITYMILFGAMFGDVGQGLIFVLGGFLLSKIKNKDFGGLIVRLGFSSVIFGFLYGSFFGLETVIPALLIRPYENINTILVMAIVMGIMLLIMSYGLGIYNLRRENNLEELYFGEKGITGFILYLLILSLALNLALSFKIMPIQLNGVLIGLCLLLMVFKRPLANKLQKNENLYNGEPVSGYYIEGSFSIIETLLSIFSGTVSFIRVGAFAINHVGLFLAFTTIGNMIGTKTGNIAMIIVGNILIMGLEGLIVFIQSLRLEYYEMFSKYYKGDGIDFIPSKNKF